MAAEIGLIASAVGVVGFVGQVTQGCLYLKNLLDDVQDGSAELGVLWRELELAAANAQDLGNLWNRLKESGVATIDPSACLRNCNEAVLVLTEQIRPLLLVLSNPDSRITGTQRNWQKMKSALRKKTMMEKFENLSRARQALVEVQLNMSLATANAQRNSTCDVSLSISQLQTSSRASDEILGQVHQLSGLGATRMLKAQHDIDSLQAGSAASGRVLQEVSSRTSAIAARMSEHNESLSALKSASDASSEQLSQVMEGIKRAEAGLDGFYGRMASTARRSVGDFDNFRGYLLAEIQAGFAEQLHSQETFLSGVSQAVDSSIQVALQNQHGNLSRSDATENIKPPQNRSKSMAQGLEKQAVDYQCLLQIKTRNVCRQYAVSRSIYRSPLCRMTVQVTHYRSIPRSRTIVISLSNGGFLEVRLRFDLLKKIFVLTYCRTIYDFGLNFSFRTCNIVGPSALILKAVKEFDIELAKILFKEGRASPFDVDVNGTSLLTICFQNSQNFVLLPCCD